MNINGKKVEREKEKEVTPRWVPVSLRQPTHDGEYTVLRAEEQKHLGYRADVGWHVIGDPIQGYLTVTHWLEIPNP